VSTIDPDEGNDVPQADPGAGGTESLRGPWESEPDSVDPDDPAQPETPEADGDTDTDTDGDGEDEDGGDGGDASMAPERGRWE